MKKLEHEYKKRSVLSFFKCTVDACYDLIDHDGIEQGGYIAFLLMIGLFPFVIMLVGLIGIINHYVDEKLYNFFISMLTDSQWSSLIGALKPRIIEITNAPPQSLLTFAIISAVWSASSIFEGAKTILNRAYRVRAVKPYVLSRLFSILEFFVVILALGVFILIFTLIPQILDLVDQYITPISNLGNNFINKSIYYKSISQAAPQYIVGFVFLLYVHTALPNQRNGFMKVLPGIILTLVGWYVCSVALEYYIEFFSQINFIYGSIAGIIISLLYFYFCSIIFIYGAEFNYLYSKWLKAPN